MTIRQAKVIPLLLWTGCVMLPDNPVLDMQGTLCKQRDRLAASRGRVVLNPDSHLQGGWRRLASGLS